jgi:hypothetical protein
VVFIKACALNFKPISNSINKATFIYNKALKINSTNVYCGGAPRRLLNSVDFGGFQRFLASATRD